MGDRLVQRGQVDYMGGKSVKAKDGTLDFGVYDLAFEIDCDGAAVSGTDNGLFKTVATLPTHYRLIEAHCMTVEAFGSGEKGMDLVVTSTDPTAADVSITGNVQQVFTAMELKLASKGALGSAISQTPNTLIDNVSAAVHLCLINTDGSNAAATLTSGKLLIKISYLGSGLATANTTV